MEYMYNSDPYSQTQHMLFTQLESQKLNIYV